MQKCGESPSLPPGLPIVWPAGAWALLQIKRPLELADERFICKDDLNIGRNDNLAADDFRIGLRQVVPTAVHVPAPCSHCPFSYSHWWRR
jgi:hypothetical protein